MARSRINSSSKDIITDKGSVLISVVEGEQVHMDITLGWLTSLVGYTLTAKIVEANCTALDYTSTTGLQHPTVRQSGGQIATLAIIDATTTDNTFKLVIPEALVDNYVTQPLPGKPVYGWIGLEVRDTGAGSAQQIWKPFRGLVEIVYSPSEEV